MGRNDWIRYSPSANSQLINSAVVTLSYCVRQIINMKRRTTPDELFVPGAQFEHLFILFLTIDLYA
jgi:hypothetical protein